MKLLSVVGALALVATLSAPAGAQPEGRRLGKVLFFTKSSGFEHSVVKRHGDQLSWAEQRLTALGDLYGFTVDCTKDGSRITPEGLAPYDVLVMYTTGDLTKEGTDKQPPLPAEGRQTLIDFVAGGKGLVGIHTATDTFNHGQGVDPYISLIGGEFTSHGAQQVATMEALAPAFPGLEALANYDLNDEWYCFKNLATDMQVILRQKTEGMKGEQYEGKPSYPATWCRTQGQGRVFYTSMGHREDVWTNPVFHLVLMAGLRWAAGETRFTPTPDIETATPGVAVAPAP